METDTKPQTQKKLLEFLQKGRETEGVTFKDSFNIIEGTKANILGLMLIGKCGLERAQMLSKESKFEERLKEELGITEDQYFQLFAGSDIKLTVDLLSKGVFFRKNS